MNQFVEQGHLGGYVAGGDDATYYPALWDWLVDGYGVRSVIDVGSGDGVAIDYFRDKLKQKKNYIARNVIGVEGVKQPESKGIIQHDYTIGVWPWGQANSTHYDLIWCCEFVEHVEEKYVPNFLDTFSIADTVLMTHAEPGQQGYHHVNCQPASYWVQKMKEIGYTLDSALTIQTRILAGKNENPYNHYVRSGLAFIRS